MNNKPLGHKFCLYARRASDWNRPNHINNSFMVYEGERIGYPKHKINVDIYDYYKVFPINRLTYLVGRTSIMCNIRKECDD